MTLIWRSWAQRGNIARFNTFDTIRPTERLAQASCSQNAFYLDDQMSGWEFHGNLIINSTTGVLIGGGRRNKIHGNHFVNNDKDIAFDNRGMNWESAACKSDCTSKTSSFCYITALEAVNYKNPPYSLEYPELIDIFSPSSHPCVPVGNAIDSNTYCHTKSHGGGLFIDRNVSTVQSWFSEMSNNHESCQ